MKTKLKNIESLDELEVGTVIKRGFNSRKILGRAGSVVFVSHDFNGGYEFTATLEDLRGYQLEVPNEKWRPEMGEAYYIPDISSDRLWATSTWRNDGFDNKWLAKGLVFKSPEEVIAAAKKMLEAINN